MPLNCHQSYQRGVLVIAFMITTNVFLFSLSSFPSSIIFLLSLSLFLSLARSLVLSLSLHSRSYNKRI